MPASLRALDLPPPFRLVALGEARDAFAYACVHAAELGAGTLVLVGRLDPAEFAVVLEPDEALTEARRSFYAGMTAVANALATLAPPETSIAIDWPDRLQVGRALVGGGRLGWPQRADERERPDWLVFGAVIRLASIGRGKAFPAPFSSLADEGFGEFLAERLVEAFARHLMVAMDRWQEGEFGAIARNYLARLRPEPGRRHRIDARGDLRVQRVGEPETSLELCAALSAPSWLDREPAGYCECPG